MWRNVRSVQSQAQGRMATAECGDEECVPTWVPALQMAMAGW